jgi:hypothetical protein
MSTKIEKLLGAFRQAAVGPQNAKPSRRKNFTCLARILLTASTRPRTGIRKCCAASKACSTRVGWAALAISRSCRWIKASSTRRVASFAPNPDYFDPENIVKLAVEGGCNAVASTLGVLGAVSRKYAHKIPFLVKLNHNELMTCPNKFDQVYFGQVEQAWNMGAAAIGATIYFGSAESTRQNRRDQRGLQTRA